MIGNEEYGGPAHHEAPDIASKDLTTNHLLRQDSHVYGKPEPRQVRTALTSDHNAKNRRRIILTSCDRRIRFSKLLHRVVVKHGGEIFIDGAECEPTQEPAAEKEMTARLQLVHRVSRE
jgi:hypothetical protein